MQNYGVLLCLFIGFFFACQGGGSKAASAGNFSDEQKQAQQALWDDLMAVHDGIMPKISQIHKLSRQLRNHAETAENLSPEVMEKILATVETLDQADEGMFSWMNNLRQLKPLQDTEKHEDILTYLKKEQATIAEVKRNMLNSIEKGTLLVEELGITNQQ